MKNSTKIILWLIFFFPYGLYLLIRQVLFKVQQQFDAQEETRQKRQEEREKRAEEQRIADEEAAQEKKKEENIKWQKKYGEKIAKQKMALAKAKREELYTH